MSGDAFHADVLELGGLRLPYLAAGALQAIEGGVLAPAGAISLLHPLGDTSFFRHGWNSWSPTGWRSLSAPPLRVYDDPHRLLTADDADNDTPLAHSGSAVGALALPSGEILLLGSLGLGSPRVGATTSSLWGTVEEDAEWFIAVGDEQRVFGRYAELIAERLGSRSTRAGRVWCSWYSFYEDISEEIIGDVVEGLRPLPFDVVQLDDGWERSVGDWEANDRFPSGMDALASRISDAGFRPGLWLAPLIALPTSHFARERPELLVQDANGEPLPAGFNWGGPYYALDTSRTEVQNHLRELFERVTGWGFSYLKLDFMYAGALAGRRSHDIHRETAYRNAVALIRETVGDDTYLLGCGIPILPSAGIFDGARVGPDVAAFWDNAERPRDPTGPGAKNAITTSLNRRWLGRLFETDPDVAYFRRRRSLLDEPQRQAVEDVATVLGFKSTSDPASWLGPGEVAELRSWLERSETVRRLGRYRYDIDGRHVDFEPFIDRVAPPSTTVN